MNKKQLAFKLKTIIKGNKFWKSALDKIIFAFGISNNEAFGSLKSIIEKKLKI